MKKKLNVTNIENELRGGSAFFTRPDENTSPAQKAAQNFEQVFEQNSEQEFEQKFEQVSKNLSTDLSKGLSTDLSVDLSVDLSKKLSKGLSKKVSKGLSKKLSKGLSIPLDVDEIEAVSFKLRKIVKAKVNTEIPLDWKDQMDFISHKLGVGKYDLMMYLIGKFLGRV
jgi:hypothetical protein